jgi:hypothetical protein
VVPLAHQVVALVRELEPLTGDGRYLFPSLLTSERPISECHAELGAASARFPKDEHTRTAFDRWRRPG